jgi:hypothetical protein
MSLLRHPIRREAVLPLVLAIAWLALVAWRPFSFGFYHDDWHSVALPLDRSDGLMKILAGDPARPLYIVILYALRTLLPDHAWAWQAMLAITHLACAWGIARAANALFLPPAAVRDASLWPGAVAGAAWLAFPWSLGYSAWPVMLPPLVGMTMAAWSLALLANASDRRSLMMGGVLLCASWMIYEASWFFWLPLALLLAARARRPLEGDRARWRWIGWMAALQVAFIAANRMLAAGSPVAKRMSLDLAGTLGTDLHLLQAQLLPQVNGVWLPLSAGLGLLALLAVVQSARTGSLLRLLAHTVMAICGSTITVVLYAAAGYAIEWEGLFSRVTLAISFWLALLLGALATASQGASPKPLRWLACTGGLMICAALGTSLLQQSDPWRRSWEEQQAVVAAIPPQLLKVSDARTLVLMDLPRGPAPVYGFSAFWDISGALAALLPLEQTRATEQTRTTGIHAFATTLRPKEWRTKWDGEFVSQAWCSTPDSPLWRLSAERVFLWRYPQEEVASIAPGFTIGCDDQGIH